MSEKRRQARIQGGWATSSNPIHVPVNSKQNLKKPHSFQFQPTVQVKSKPTDIIYKENGEYILSETSKGVSRIRLFHQFIPQENCEWMFEHLLCEIPWQQEKVIIKGESKLQPRLTAWYGDMSYTYSGLTLNPYQFSPVLEMLREKIMSATNVHLNSMLANLYRTEKDSVDWHSDDELSLGKKPVIASLSFGETRTFELRKKPSLEGEDYANSQHVRIPLSSGSLLFMEGATQSDWQHRVPKEYHDRGSRINLTFREIASDD